MVEVVSSVGEIGDYMNASVALLPLSLVRYKAQT